MTTRAVREQLLAGVLMCSSVFAAKSPAYIRKDENNPDKIGHRAVARRSIISPEKDRPIGKQYAEQFERSVELVQDTVVEQYVTTVAGSVVSHSDWKGPVTVKVIRSPEVNSFSFPGGFIYLSTGLLLAAQNEDEIAGVIANQVAHAAARHWASEATKATILQCAMIPSLTFPTNTAAQLPPMCGDLVWPGYSGRGSQGVPLIYLKSQRRDELEADYLGLQYVYTAGYDPREYVALLARLAPKDAASQRQPDVLQGTPPASERIAQADEEIQKILPNAPPPRSSPEFVLMKSRL
jgi:predicted Zn-dependent protease